MSQVLGSDLCCSKPSASPCLELFCSGITISSLKSVMIIGNIIGFSPVRDWRTCLGSSWRPSGLIREPSRLLEWTQPEHVAVTLSKPTSPVQSLCARHHKFWESGEGSCAPPTLWQGRAGSSWESRSWHWSVLGGSPFDLTCVPG